MFVLVCWLFHIYIVFGGFHFLYTVFLGDLKSFSTLLNIFVFTTLYFNLLMNPQYSVVNSADLMILQWRFWIHLWPKVKWRCKWIDCHVILWIICNLFMSEFYYRIACVCSLSIYYVKHTSFSFSLMNLNSNGKKDHRFEQTSKGKNATHWSDFLENSNQLFFVKIRNFHQLIWISQRSYGNVI